MQMTWKRETLTDVVNLMLGAWLFLSPWIFGFVSTTAASWNAWLSGIVIAGLAIAALVAFAEWQEWVNLIAGIWAIVSPWLVGFSANATAAWVHVVVGVIVAAIAAVRLWLIHQGPPRVTA
jgi:uncharacterized membrane protein HdeD (DUF308 family)